MIGRYISADNQRIKLNQPFDDRLLHVSDVEDVRVLDDDIIHMYRVKLGEITRERDEIDRCSLVELEQMIGVVSTIVPLPPKIPQDLLK